MIEATDEMKAAFRTAQEQRAAELVAEGAPLGAHDILDRGLAAVLAIVERDYDVEPKTPPFEHRMARSPYWNHYHAVFGVECTCGAEFSAYTERDAQWRLEDHIEDHATSEVA